MRHDANKLVSLIPATPGEIDGVLREFEEIVPQTFSGPRPFKHMVDEGWTIPAFVLVDQVPAYVICYHIAADNGLWIDVAKTMRRMGDFADLNRAVDLLAEKHHCPYIRFITARRGLVETQKRFGYQPEGILISKGVS